MTSLAENGFQHSTENVDQVEFESHAIHLKEATQTGEKLVGSDLISLMLISGFPSPSSLDPRCQNGSVHQVQHSR